jgi:uncharacterized protein
MPDFLAALDWSTILPFVAIGFAAQIVDGALGMAFGLITSTLMVTVMGTPPALASASVHAVETFTTAASGVSHVVNRNVDWRLFRRLVIPGMIGAVLGATVLSSIDGSVARPFVMAYLALIGGYLIFRTIRGNGDPHQARVVAPLGLVGGFLDAAGGGGWGPVVTSNLLVQGTTPRHTIGTVNTAEFFLTLTASVAFFVSLGWAAFTLQTVGLLIGGLVAAPLGGILAKRVAPRRLMAFVGVLLAATSLWSSYSALAK